MALSEPQYGTIALTDAGFGTIAPAVSGAAIRVLGYAYSASGATSVRFFTGTATALSGTLLGTTDGFYVAPYNPAGHFQTAASAALFGSCSAGTVTGHLTYVLKS